MKHLAYLKADATVPTARVSVEPPSITVWGGRVMDPIRSDDPQALDVTKYDRWTWRIVVATQRKPKATHDRALQQARIRRELVIRLWRRVAVRAFDPEKDL